MADMAWCQGEPAPVIDEAKLAASRHSCTIVRDACLFNASIFPREPVSAALRRLGVRSPTYSHHMSDAGSWLGLRPAPAGSFASALIRRRVMRHGFSPCVPLVWLPVWGTNFAEMMGNAVAPLFELTVETRALDRRLLLRPDLGHGVWWWRRPRFFDELLRPFAVHSPRLFREVAPVCSARRAQATLRHDDNRTRRCATDCYARLVLCNPKSIFDDDRFAPPAAPWRAAQFVAARVLGEEAPEGQPPASSSSAASAAANGGGAVLRVLFVNRTGAGQRVPGKENLHNLAQLLARCDAHTLRRPAAPPGAAGAPPAARAGGGHVRLACGVHAFGTAGLAEDIRRVRQADVLVGTHGAALFNGLFMRRGGSMVEVRAYGFEGRWPDLYMKHTLQVEDAVLHFHVATRSAELMHPRPQPGVTGWAARDNRAVELPWRTLAEVLRAVLWANRTGARYRQLPTRSFESTARGEALEG